MPSARRRGRALPRRGRHPSQPQDRAGLDEARATEGGVDARMQPEALPRRRVGRQGAPARLRSKASGRTACCSCSCSTSWPRRTTPTPNGSISSSTTTASTTASQVRLAIEVGGGGEAGAPLPAAVLPRPQPDRADLEGPARQRHPQPPLRVDGGAHGRGAGLPGGPKSTGASHLRTGESRMNRAPQNSTRLFSRRSYRCTTGSSNSCKTFGVEARRSSVHRSDRSSSHLPETPDEHRSNRGAGANFAAKWRAWVTLPEPRIAWAREMLAGAGGGVLGEPGVDVHVRGRDVVARLKVVYQRLGGLDLLRRRAVLVEVAHQADADAVVVDGRRLGVAAVSSPALVAPAPGDLDLAVRATRPVADDEVIAAPRRAEPRAVLAVDLGITPLGLGAVVQDDVPPRADPPSAAGTGRPGR